MVSTRDREVLFDRLDDALRQAHAPGPDLFAKVVTGACARFPLVSGEAKRIDRLIAAGAWTDAALALAALELPAWTVRRLVYDGGEWICSLSRQPSLPEALDEAADASHALMPLAILRAFLQARRMADAARRAMSTVPQIAIGAGTAVCCENFA
jgi:hypothetical protein